LDALEVRPCSRPEIGPCYRPESRGFCPPPGKPLPCAASGGVCPVQPFLACQAARILASFSGSIPVRMPC
jgi:hypothetical protein